MNEPNISNSKCRCRHCLTERNTIKTISLTGLDLTTIETGDEFVGMIVCEFCGNKRCPHATHHIHKCTNNNDSGQEGSIYA